MGDASKCMISIQDIDSVIEKLTKPIFHVQAAVTHLNLQDVKVN